MKNSECQEYSERPIFFITINSGECKKSCCQCPDDPNCIGKFIGQMRQVGPLPTTSSKRFNRGYFIEDKNMLIRFLIKKEFLSKLGEIKRKKYFKSLKWLKNLYLLFHFYKNYFIVNCSVIFHCVGWDLMRAFRWYHYQMIWWCLLKLRAHLFLDNNERNIWKKLFRFCYLITCCLNQSNCYNQ